MSNVHTNKLCPSRCWRRCRVAGLLAVAGISAGCSLIGARAAPQTAKHDSAPPRVCTTSVWLPLADFVGLTLSAVTAVAGIDNDAHVLTALGAGGSAIFLTSALYGASTVDDCPAADAPPQPTAASGHSAL